MAFEQVNLIENVSDAANVLRYAFMYDEEMVKSAEAYLRQNDPRNPVLKSVQYEGDDLDARKTQYVSATNYESRAVATGNFDEAVGNSANEFIENYKNEVLDAAEHEEENEPTLNDSEAAERNFDMLLSSLDALEEKEEWKFHVQDLLNTVEFVDKDGKSDDKVQDLSSEAIWDAVKTDILVRHTLDFEWMRELLGRDEAAKREMLVEEIKTLYAEKVASMVATEKAREKLENPEKANENDEHFEEELVNASYWSLTNLLASKPEKTKIGVDTLLASVSHSWKKLGNFIAYLKENNFSLRLVEKVKNYKASFNDKMKRGFGKAWDFAKSAADSFVNTKHQFGWNLAATAAVGAISLACPPAAIPALKVYALYTGASGCLFPFVNKKTAELRKAKKELKALEAQKNVDPQTIFAAQEKVESLKGLKGLKAGANAIWASDRERKTYYIKAASSIAIGALTFGIAGSSAANVAVNAATVAATRIKQSLTRAAGSIGAQVATLVSAYTQKVRHPSEEAEKFVKQSWLGLGLGAVVAGGAAWLQMDRLNGLGNSGAGDLAKGTDGLINKGDIKPGTFYTDTLKNGNDSIPAITKIGNDSIVAGNNVDIDQGVDGDGTIAPLTEAENFYENYQAPMEWSDDMGISEREYNWLRKTLGGVYATAEGAEHFGTPQVDSDLLYQDYMKNLATYMHEHPEQFEGQQPVKVLHDIMMRHALSVAVHSDGDKHLIATLTENGDFTYGNPKFNEPMNAWWRILCGSYKNVPAEGIDLKAPLNDLQSDLAYAAKHGNGNYIIGHDCDQTAYMKGHRILPRPTKPEEIVPPTETIEETKVVEDVPQLSKKEVLSREVGDAHGPQSTVTIKEGSTINGKGLGVNPNPNDPNGNLKNLGTYGLNKGNGGR